jgi:hypothetical protein
MYLVAESSVLARAALLIESRSCVIAQTFSGEKIMIKKDVLRLWRKFFVLTVLTVGLLFALAPSQAGAVAKLCDVICPDGGWHCIQEGGQDRCVCDTDECCAATFPGDPCCGGQCIFYPRAPMCYVNNCPL